MINMHKNAMTFELNNLYYRNVNVKSYTYL